MIADESAEQSATLATATGEAAGASGAKVRRCAEAGPVVAPSRVGRVELWDGSEALGGRMLLNLTGSSWGSGLK